MMLIEMLMKMFVGGALGVNCILARNTDVALQEGAVVVLSGCTGSARGLVCHTSGGQNSEKGDSEMGRHGS
jgi:hypothetical protein